MSSLKDLASLIMVPSLYKDGELHTVKPLGNSILHPDATGNHDGTDGSTPAEGNFTFSRGSNLAATRVDVNGLIEKGRENLLLRSNAFDNAYWNKSDSSVVTGQADPNGGSNAFKIVENTNTAYHRIFGNYTMVSGNVYATSVTAKAAGRNYLTLSNNVSAGTCIFNLIDGSISLQESNVISASTTSLGGGWYRCEMVAVGDKSGTYNVFIGCDDDGVIAPYTGDGTSGVLIYQSQLEAGLVATDYIETGASTAQAGILEDMPRLDYSGGASCPALLLEPQRTNLLAYSEYFSASGVWLPNTITITDNYGTSPEGLSNSTRLVLGNLTASRIAYAPTLANGTTYTFSCYYKGTAGEKLYMEGNGSGGSGTQTSKLITLTGEWQREDLQFVGGSTSNLIYVVDSRNGTEDTAQDFEVFGAQVEAGSYPTSYIPTYGSSVTRSRDFAEATFAENDIAPTGGTTLFIEFETSGEVDTTPNTGGFYLKNNAGTLGYWGMSFGYGDRIYSNYQNGSTIQWDGATAENTLCKVAFQLVNGGKSFLNGTTKATTSVDWSTRPLGQLELQYGTKVKQAILFPTILTDAECIALTTI